MDKILKSELQLHCSLLVIYHFKIEPRLVRSLMLGLITIWSCLKNVLFQITIFNKAIKPGHSRLTQRIIGFRCQINL
jgi:hypothetical protein